MLNAKQEKFINNIIKGMSQRQAYKDAYQVKYKDNVIDNRASELFNKSEVQVRYKELLEKAQEEAIMSAIERKKWLTKVINGEIQEESKYYDDGDVIVYEKRADINTKIKALDTLNKMDNLYTTKFDGNLDVTIEVGIDES